MTPDKPLDDPRELSPAKAAWNHLIAPYQRPAAWRGLWQVANTLLPYAALWVLMAWSLTVSWWLTFGLAVLAAGFLVRIFIIFHDCGHGSFLPWKRANDALGFLTGVLTFTPYHHWRWEHALHHASAGNLDRRGVGDVWTLTVEEYRSASRWKRLAYRLARHPLVLFGLAPLALFLVVQRFPSPKAGRRERLSVHATNLALVGMGGGLSLLLGWKACLVLHLVVLALAGLAGVWLFYVQHQFEGAYWARRGVWDYARVALEGSSFYRLPRVLQWFSGNIGFHHVHHLKPGIPNYHLEAAHRAVPLFQSVPVMTLRSSLKSLRFHLWDEEQQRLVSFAALRQPRRARATP